MCNGPSGWLGRDAGGSEVGIHVGGPNLLPRVPPRGSQGRSPADIFEALLPSSVMTNLQPEVPLRDHGVGDRYVVMGFRAILHGNGAATRN